MNLNPNKNKHPKPYPNQCPNQNPNPYHNPYPSPYPSPTVYPVARVNYRVLVRLSIEPTPSLFCDSALFCENTTKNCKGSSIKDVRKEEGGGSREKGHVRT